MVEYDSNSNPRHLESVSAEAVERVEDELSNLDTAIEQAGKKVGVFNSKGWKLIQDDLVAEWQRGDAAIRSRNTSLSNVEYLRGQLHAYEFLLSLATSSKQQHDGLLARKRLLEQEIERETG